MNDLEPDALDGPSSAVEQDNSHEVRPTTAKGSELQSWRQIIDLYGGDCWYQLLAQCSKTHCYTAKTDKIFFSGPLRKPSRARRGR